MARLNWRKANERARISRDIGHGRAVAMEPPRGADPGPQCPSCGAFMFRRMGVRGPFWGCSRFPFCKGLVPIE